MELSKDGNITQSIINPNDYNIAPATLSDIAGGDAAYNAKQLRAVLKYTPEHNQAYADIICLNAGAALTLSDISKDIASGIEMAQQALQSGKAYQKLARYIDFLKQ